MQDKQAKQNFLRNEIIEGGLDPESFMDFMGTVKNEGENIELDNWTFEDLKKLVQDFKTQIQKDTSTLIEIQKSEVRESKEIMSKIASSRIKKEKVHYDKGLWDYEINGQEEECKKMERVFEFKQKPLVKVVNWEVKTHGGFFLGFGATKELWVTLETNFTQYSISRTNADFEWYRNALHKMHPGSFIPPLSELRNIEPEDKKGLGNRARLIGQFLQSLTNYEHLIQCHISKVFLLERDHNTFMNFKNKERNTNYPNNVGRIQTIDGRFTIDITQSKLKETKNCSGFSKIAVELYQEARVQIGKILSDMESLSKHVHQISNTCGKLHQKYSKICGLNHIEGSSMETMMIYLNNLFSNIGKNIKSQMQTIKRFEQDCVEFSLRSWEEFSLQDKRHQKDFDSYLNFKYDLLKKKERNYMDQSKWELERQEDIQRMSRINVQAMDKQEAFDMMFPRENQQEEEMKIWFAFQDSVYKQSFRSLLAEEEDQLKSRFGVFIEEGQKISEENFQAVKQFKEILEAH